MARNLGVSDETYERLVFAANVAGTTPEDIVERLVRDWSSRGSTPAPKRSHSAERAVAVHADYRGARATGTYDPLTNALRVDSGPCAGKRFTSPSAAAIAVTVEVNPDRRHPNTNGKNFWTATEHRVPLGTWLDRRPVNS